MKKFLKVIAGIVFFVCLISHNSFAQQSPVDLLQSIADQMIQQLKAHKATLKTQPGVVYDLANKIVVPHADLYEMARRVLPPRIWQSATPTQQKEFIREFTMVLERTYASALAEYTNEVVKFYPVRGGYENKTSVTVNSKIVRSDGPDIQVSYLVLLRGSTWKLYDMSVEGVSLLESFRSQFADSLSRGNIASLIKDLRAHNAKQRQ